MKIHRYTIFINQETATKQTQETVNYIIKSLVSCRVPRQSVKICDVSKNAELKEMIEETVNGMPYPLLYLWGEYYGIYEDVQRGMNDGTLQLSVLNDPNKKHQGERYGLIKPKSDLENAAIYEDYTNIPKKKDIFKEKDIIDEYTNSDLAEVLVELKGVSENREIQIEESSFISASEWILRFISGMLFIPLIKRVFVSKTVEKEEGDIEFKVIRTNWCWKHQERIIRFSKEKFYRFNGETFREEFSYDDVKEVIVDGNAIVINFTSNSNSQFIECAEIDQFIQTFQSHCPSLEIKHVEKE